MIISFALNNMYKPLTSVYFIYKNLTADHMWTAYRFPPSPLNICTKNSDLESTFKAMRQFKYINVLINRSILNIEV